MKNDYKKQMVPLEKVVMGRVNELFYSGEITYFYKRSISSKIS